MAFVRGEHHHHIGHSRRLVRGHDGEAGVLGFGPASGAFAQADNDVLRAAVPQVVGVGMALAAIAQYGDGPRLDEVEVGVAIVIDAHGVGFLSSV